MLAARKVSKRGLGRLPQKREQSKSQFSRLKANSRNKKKPTDYEKASAVDTL
jgi:hypothetical protein